MKKRKDKTDKKLTKFQEDDEERKREMEEGQEKEATGYVSQTRDITGSFNRQLEDRL